MRGLPLRQLRHRAAKPAEHGYRIACVYWDDTHPITGWHDPAELDDGPCTIVSCGYILPLTAKAEHLTIAQDVAPDGEVNGVSHLPLACVRRVDFLT